MPDPISATIGAVVVGGGASYLAGKEAASAQDRATAAAQRASDAQIAFQQQQYEDWKSVFGDTQENLAAYYNTLGAAKFEALGIQNIEKEVATSRDILTKQLAQRGLATSGAAAQGLTQLEQARATGIANVRATSEQQVAQQRMQFLGLGSGQQGVLQQGIANAYGQQATNQMALAGQYGQAAYAGMSGVGQAIGTGLSTYMTYNALNPAGGAMSMLQNTGATSAQRMAALNSLTPGF